MRALVAVLAFAVAGCGDGNAAPTNAPGTGGTPGTPTNVDAYLTACPTASDVASINADFVLTFTVDPTVDQPLACRASDGSADLTFFKRRIYQALLLTKQIPFDAAFPWTNQSLYDWLNAAIVGITFDVTSGGFCCSPAGVIHITGGSNNCAIAGGTSTRWIATGMPCGLDGTLAVIAHEARHAQGFPHTCGTNDNTIGELGAWGVQYHLLRWFSLHTGTYLTPADGQPNTGFYRITAQNQANSLCASRFCQEGCPGS